MTTMIGEQTRSCPHCDVPPWDPLFPVVITSSVNFNANAWGHESVIPMRGCLPSHHPATDEVDGVITSSVNFNANAWGHESVIPMRGCLPSHHAATDEVDMTVDVFSSDYFRIFDFKVRRCVRARAHDWTECPYAHPGEKARRRDPRKYHYLGTLCEEFRKGSCRKGDSCEFAHGIFECWLHPARYRTQPCKDGLDCHRRVCFFAHSPEQLRIINQNDRPTQGPYELFVGGSPSSVRIGLKEPFVSSPTSIIASPPLSPLSEASPMQPNRPPISCQLVSEIVSSMQNVHLARKKKSYPCQWKFDNPNRSGLSVCKYWVRKCEEEEPAMERVESGRNLRVKMYAKLSKENSLGRNQWAVSSPDIGWVSELIK